ncbi:hypothetical protein NADFUDRAFT_84491 [Nadsonia fulvescens var. elongata DSM 6958]|uniref:Uncharacterized protein n=1 Tax=Nadsonia fulvescens var. elongata DSM 6958 TaxID=857566 RepID=A0A1E3PD69_9ASCO|nr:hypothetical protein NADFUDRAFT_84491 [Nadsonia fulvescens var. elongata DSM 6958]
MLLHKDEMDELDADPTDRLKLFVKDDENFKELDSEDGLHSLTDVLDAATDVGYL